VEVPEVALASSTLGSLSRQHGLRVNSLQWEVSEREHDFAGPNQTVIYCRKDLSGKPATKRTLEVRILNDCDRSVWCPFELGISERLKFCRNGRS
jgi:hypothetical protein